MITTTMLIEMIRDNICLWGINTYNVCLSHIMPPLYQRFGATEL